MKDVVEILMSGAMDGTRGQGTLREQMEAALTALDAAEYAVVPQEVTEEMLKAFQRQASRGKDCDIAIIAAIAAGSVKP